LHVFIDTFLRYDDGRELPSNEFIRIVRIMIKQLHDFSSSADVDNTPMRALRQQAQHCLNARFYPFLKSMIDRWPLDNSFSLVLEMYLSYIQPWRYNFNRSQSKETPIIGKYATFVAENLFCYTQIFVRLLTRFQRMDLSSYKNVLMLYRLLKVFSQSNLIEVIRINENSMAAGISKISGRSTSFNQNSLDSSHHSSNRTSPNHSINQSLNLTQPDDSNYVMMTQSDEITAQVLDLMRKIIGSKMRVNETIQKTEKELHQKFGIFESIVRYIPFLMYFSDADSSFTAHLEENRQIPEILNFTLSCFSNFYSVSFVIISSP
jgi:sphingomyelin phosphodiesterase 4